MLFAILFTFWRFSEIVTLVRLIPPLPPTPHNQTNRTTDPHNGHARLLRAPAPRLQPHDAHPHPAHVHRLDHRAGLVRLHTLQLPPVLRQRPLRRRHRPGLCRRAHRRRLLPPVHRHRRLRRHRARVERGLGPRGAGESEGGDGVGCERQQGVRDAEGVFWAGDYECHLLFLDRGDGVDSWGACGED